MKLTDNELNELKYHYVDRVVDNMSTKDLVQYVFDDMLRYIETIPEVEFLGIVKIIGKSILMML